ncbi:parathyroid hormone-related protein isoform X1 [Silurus meridionalis]|nr:parathyroid hormone-related protein isoform X1 [Silurus meridionalis]
MAQILSFRFDRAVSPVDDRHGNDSLGLMITRMLCSGRILQQWCLAVFLLCSPVPHYGRPIDALSNRIKRSVTHAQLMHDKGRTLQEFKRRMWLQELLHEVHTAELHEVQQRGGISGGGGSISVGVPMGVGMGISLSPGTANPKPVGGTKNLPISFSPEDEEGTNLPQETNKSQIYKDGAPKAGMKKKKKGKAGKRRDGEKRKRRTRSPDRPEAIEPDNGFHVEQWIHTAQRAAVH